MNIFTDFANQYLFNKTRLIHLLENLNYSNEFIKEFRNNWIFINENQIRKKMRCFCEITQDESFKDLCCHDNGIQLVFYSIPHEYPFINFRISFDIKILSLTLNKQQQSMHILISNIKIKSLNYLSKLFQFCVQCKARTLVTDEFERICSEQSMSYERLFTNVRRPLAYRMNLDNIKELDQLRKEYFFMGNRSILDFIQINGVEHREKAIVLGYRFKSLVYEKTSQYSL